MTRMRTRERQYGTSIGCEFILFDADCWAPHITTSQARISETHILSGPPAVRERDDDSYNGITGDIGSITNDIYGRREAAFRV
jgi:hypothetical protein